MDNVETLELVSQENNLIKSTPAEETLKKIHQMRAASVKADNNVKIGRMSLVALMYVVKYLRHRHHLSDEQIKDLSSEDLNRIPEMIFTDRGKQVLLLGWVPLFGWFFLCQYLLFKSRVKYLKSLDEKIFDTSDVQLAIIRSYSSYYLD